VGNRRESWRVPADFGWHGTDRLKAVLGQFHGRATQGAKRAMLALRLVPPPFRIQIDVTDRCNFRCPTCSKWKAPPSAGELEAEQWKRVLDRVRHAALLREISISGGEPFARPDLLEILALAKGHRLRVVLVSNGWFLDEDVLRELEEIGLDRLLISLNSLEREVHDESRATPGSYDRIMRFIELWCSKPREVDLCLTTIVMEPNCGELSSMARFAHQQGLDGIIFQVLAPDGAHYSFGQASSMPRTTDAWYATDPYWVRNISLLRQQVAELLRMQGRGCPIINPPSQLRSFTRYFEDPEAVRTVPCLGTLSRLYIDPFGDVRLCYGYPSIGNILEDNPFQLWWGRQARRIRQQSKACTRPCRMLNNNL
jgi:MoaA/NifB/PqqE/SkfB family radical SAM enzyme